MTRPDPAEWKPRFLEALAMPDQLMHVHNAAVIAGISRKTAYAHRERDEEFAAAWDEIKERNKDNLRELVAEKSREDTRVLLFRAERELPEYRRSLADEIAATEYLRRLVEADRRMADTVPFVPPGMQRETLPNSAGGNGKK